jgi:hypothetical protein
MYNIKYFFSIKIIKQFRWDNFFKKDRKYYLRASAPQCQIDCQISLDNCHLNFKDAETKQK